MLCHGWSDKPANVKCWISKTQGSRKMIQGTGKQFLVGYPPDMTWPTGFYCGHFYSHVKLSGLPTQSEKLQCMRFGAGLAARIIWFLTYFAPAFAILHLDVPQPANITNSKYHSCPQLCFDLAGGCMWLRFCTWLKVSAASLAARAYLTRSSMLTNSACSSCSLCLGSCA